MEASPGAPLLLDTIDRLLARERRRRRDAALRRALLATTLAIVIVALWRVGDRIYAREPMPVPYAAFLVGAIFVAGVVVTLRRAAGGSAASMARELDRRLGLADRASSALAVVRGAADSRLASFVLHDAETAIGHAAARIDVHFPAAPRGRRFLTARRLAIVAGVAIALALVAELLTVGGPLRWLPGATPDATKEPAGEPPRDEPRPGGGPGEQGKDPARPEAKPERPEDEPKPADAKGDVRVTLRMAKEEYGPDEPVAATVCAAATGPLQGASSFDVRVSVDDDEIDAGVRMDVDPAHPEGTGADLDLAKIPGLRLPPGEHTARARLTTRTDREEHASPPVKFRIRDRAGKSGDDGGGKKPPPKPEPKPKPQQPKPDQPEPKDGPPNAPPPLPPPQLDRKFVVPLFGEGELVKKKGPVLVLEPGGGTDAPPERRPIGDALPEAKRRAEAAVDQARLSDADRELVRRYFELLEGLRR
jgi:hypothetical protein